MFKWVLIGTLAAIFLIWTLSISLRYLLSRLNLWLQLQRMKGFSKDSKLKYKSIFSLLANINSKTSQFLFYSKGTLYIVKLCGCYKKKTDIVALDPGRWQIFTVNSFNLSQEKEPQVKATDLDLKFNLNRESQIIKEAIGNKGINIRNVILFAPKPAGFYSKHQGNNEAVGFGAEWNNCLIATVPVMLELIKNSEPGKSEISNEDWDRIVKEYKNIE